MHAKLLQNCRIKLLTNTLLGCSGPPLLLRRTSSHCESGLGQARAGDEGPRSFCSARRRPLLLLLLLVGLDIILNRRKPKSHSKYIVLNFGH